MAALLCQSRDAAFHYVNAKCRNPRPYFLEQISPINNRRLLRECALPKGGALIEAPSFPEQPPTPSARGSIASIDSSITSIGSSICTSASSIDGTASPSSRRGPPVPKGPAGRCQFPAPLPRGPHRGPLRHGQTPPLSSDRISVPPPAVPSPEPPPLPVPMVSMVASAPLYAVDASGYAPHGMTPVSTACTPVALSAPVALCTPPIVGLPPFLADQLVCQQVGEAFRLFGFGALSCPPPPMPVSGTATPMSMSMSMSMAPTPSLTTCSTPLSPTSPPFIPLQTMETGIQAMRCPPASQKAPPAPKCAVPTGDGDRPRFVAAPAETACRVRKGPKDRERRPVIANGSDEDRVVANGSHGGGGEGEEKVPTVRRRQTLVGVAKREHDEEGEAGDSEATSDDASSESSDDDEQATPRATSKAVKAASIAG